MRYILTRLIAAAVVVLVSSTLVFFLLRTAGDPASVLALETSGQAEIAQLRHQLGLDKPLYVQYGQFLAGAVTGDFGTSFRYNQPALKLVFERMPATIALALGAFIVSVLVAIPLGIAAALKRGSFIDWICSAIAVAGQSTPIFLLGILLIVVFSVNLHLFPSSGTGTPAHLVLPVISLAAYSLPLTMRILRSSMLDVLGSDFIRTARSKGLSERIVVYVHALRNALIPVTTVLGLRMGALLGGAVITEQVFGFPGMGRLALQALSYRDFPVIQAFITVTALIVALLNLTVDLLYGLLDPRIQIGS